MTTKKGPVYQMVEEIASKYQMDYDYSRTNPFTEENIEAGIYAGVMYGILPKIQELEPVWIPVEERLPEKHIGGGAIDVLTCDSEGRVIVNCYFRDDDFPEEGEWSECDVDILYWMPIPLPPTTNK